MLKIGHWFITIVWIDHSRKFSFLFFLRWFSSCYLFQIFIHVHIIFSFCEEFRIVIWVYFFQINLITGIICSHMCFACLSLGCILSYHALSAHPVCSTAFFEACTGQTSQIVSWYGTQCSKIQLFFTSNDKGMSCFLFVIINITLLKLLAKYMSISYLLILSNHKR